MSRAEIIRPRAKLHQSELRTRSIHNHLIERKQTLAIAESCTGGTLSYCFTSLADASRYFLGSFVTYCDSWKKEVLGVSAKTLGTAGAVSRECAHEMWLGLMKKSGADFGIVTTGIAGPSGGVEGKPVGTVFIGVGAKEKKPKILECYFNGTREEIIQQACQQALEAFSALIIEK